MSSLAFVIPGEPVAKGRPRIGKDFKTGRPKNVTPEKTVRFESRARHEAWLAMHGSKKPLLEGAVLLVVDAFFCARSGARHTTSVPKTTKPDASNIVKAVEDAMNAVVFTDDARVVELTVRKWWAPPGVPARTEVTVTSLDGEWET